jgi:hypothetical protein
MLSLPALKSTMAVVAALAVQVNEPVLFNFPSKILLTTCDIWRGLSASYGSLRKLPSAKSPTLKLNALCVTPVSFDIHASAMKTPLNTMLTKAFVSQT